MFNEGDTQESSTDKPVALEFPIELEFDRDDNNNNKIIIIIITIIMMMTMMMII